MRLHEGGGGGLGFRVEVFRVGLGFRVRVLGLRGSGV